MNKFPKGLFLYDDHYDYNKLCKSFANKHWFASFEICFNFTPILRVL